jgi:hypothetical protein
MNLTKDAPSCQIIKKERIGPDGKHLGTTYHFQVLTYDSIMSMMSYGKRGYFYVDKYHSSNLDEVESFKQKYYYDRNTKVIKTVIE